MKKLTVLLIAVLLLSLAVFANGAKEDDNSPITLVMWTHEDPNRQKLEEGYAAEYMAMHPNVTIKYSVYPSTKIQDLIPTAYAAKTPLRFGTWNCKKRIRFWCRAWLLR